MPGVVPGSYPLSYGLGGYPLGGVSASRAAAVARARVAGGIGIGPTGVPITTVARDGKVTQTRVGPNTVTQRTSGPEGTSSTSIAAPGIGFAKPGYGAGLESIPFYNP